MLESTQRDFDRLSWHHHNLRQWSFEVQWHLHPFKHYCERPYVAPTAPVAPVDRADPDDPSVGTRSTLSLHITQHGSNQETRKEIMMLPLERRVLELEELFVLCTNLSNRVLALETSKDSQVAEILKLKDQIKKLKRKCKPSISHHRAWLKSMKRLSMKKRLGRKESVSKQERKNAKPEPTLDAFDNLDADGRD
ncbi:hypothetical protein Tco_0982611 [Tanacetum coccineum]